MRKFVFSMVIFFQVLVGVAQIPIGSWRDHFSLRLGQNVSTLGNRIVVSSNNGIFWYDMAGGSLTKFTTTNGLSGIDISAMTCSPFSNLIAVGYDDGNIDLVFDNRVVNLPFIKNKPMQSSKSINHFYFADDQRLFVSTDFGIVVVNVQKQEISDTYFIGGSGVDVLVWQVGEYKDRIYAVTNQGVYSADALSEFLVLYTNWHLETGIPYANAEYKFLAIFDNYLVVTQAISGGSRDKIFAFDGEQWQTVSNSYTTIHGLKSNGQRLAVIGGTGVKIFSQWDVVAEEFTSYHDEWSAFKPRDIFLFENEDIALADADYGLVYRKDNRWETYSPNGPYSNSTFFVLATDEDIVVTSGGRTDTWGNAYYSFSYHTLSSNLWRSRYNYSCWDALRVIQNPFKPQELYFASWGDGVVVYEDNEEIAHYNPENSTLQTVIPGRYCRVSSMAFDGSGNLWVVNSGVQNLLSVKTPNGTWKGFDYQSPTGAARTSDMLISPAGHLWIIIPSGGGLLTVDPSDNPLLQENHRYRYLRPYNAEEGNLSNDIYSMAFDKDGYMWVGTSEGVLVSYNPSQVFNSAQFRIQKVKIPDVVDGLAVYLLENETVTSITVDGANRKWFGTFRSGVFLQSADGGKQLQHFNTENSPLPSNNILSVDIHPKTGEVFIATDKGLVSFRSDATEGAKKFGKVYAFPNPVRPEYDGNIIITGLVDKALVKITDVAGNLVYETESLGGQAIWDGKNKRGQRVASGVYLYFCSDREGEETAVGKLLFIR